ILLDKIFKWLRGWWSGAGEKHEALEAEIKELWRTAPEFNPADLQEITAPTLVIVGENDIVDLQHSRDLARMLWNGSLKIVPDAGHASPVTHARQINQLIGSFLDIENPSVL
ncbi:MAG: alpha/beta hydrolase, partial [Desulfobulbaceae bacterium]|nr:alpha/beta hydrolase [Desulfobulbaceae bacterium]